MAGAKTAKDGKMLIGLNKSLLCALKLPPEIYFFQKLFILWNARLYYFTAMVAWVMNILLHSS